MSINGTLAFVILWIVNALIALVYLLVGIFLYVPACDLKREQGEEIQYDNRRAFFIRFIVMVLCPVVGPAFFLCSYLIYKTVFRQAVDLRKLRHLGPPLKYAGLTGYDLEVVESIPFTE